MHDSICWEGMGQGYTLTGHLLFQANDSCVHVNTTTFQDMHFHITTVMGNHVIYWPADKVLRTALRFQIPRDWTTLVPTDSRIYFHSYQRSRKSLNYKVKFMFSRIPIKLRHMLSTQSIEHPSCVLIMMYRVM